MRKFNVIYVDGFKAKNATEGIANFIVRAAPKSCSNDVVQRIFFFQCRAFVLLLCQVPTLSENLTQRKFSYNSTANYQQIYMKKELKSGNDIVEYYEVVLIYSSY